MVDRTSNKGVGVGTLLTMCGTCCTCAAMFTFDGPRVLGSSCLATGAAAGWTVTKLKTSKRRRERTEPLTTRRCPLSSILRPTGAPSPNHTPRAQVGKLVHEPYLCSGSYSDQQKSSALRLFQSDQPVEQKNKTSHDVT